MIWIFTHRNCPDGTGAAYAAWTVFGDRARYQPISHEDDHTATLAAVQADDEVYLADICFPYDVLVTLRHCRVTILDHHLTASPTIARARDTLGMDAHYDTRRSGAIMAWEHFHPDRPAPMLLRHIQDQDLWQFKLDHTAEVMEALTLYGEDPRVWDGLATQEEQYQLLISEGRVLLRYRHAAIERLMKNVRFVTMAGCRVPAVNSPAHNSHICHRLLELFPQAPFVASYCDVDGLRRWSLRSVEAGANVAEVAALFGGGGHARASGFVESLADTVVLAG